MHNYNTFCVRMCWPYCYSWCSLHVLITSIFPHVNAVFKAWTWTFGQVPVGELFMYVWTRKTRVFWLEALYCLLSPWFNVTNLHRSLVCLLGNVDLAEVALVLTLFTWLFTCWYINVRLQADYIEEWRCQKLHFSIKQPSGNIEPEP